MRNPHRRAGLVADLVLCLPHNRRRPRRLSPRAADLARARQRAVLRFAWDMTAGLVLVVFFAWYAFARRGAGRLPQSR